MKKVLTTLENPEWLRGHVGKSADIPIVDMNIKFGTRSWRRPHVWKFFARTVYVNVRSSGLVEQIYDAHSAGTCDSQSVN